MFSFSPEPLGWFWFAVLATLLVASTVWLVVLAVKGGRDSVYAFDRRAAVVLSVLFVGIAAYGWFFVPRTSAALKFNYGVAMLGQCALLIFIGMLHRRERRVVTPMEELRRRKKRRKMKN
jgi:putative copper export protein